MIRLVGKKALVTGGSRGIGRATCILLAAAGADVAIHYQRNEPAARETKKLVEDQGREGLLCRAEISSRADVERMVNQVGEHWGRIDILVNNAGIWTYGEMGNMAEEVWRETMAV
ncbi:MAG: SDR family NAD(P)-dependent oxidoreductase, partial [Candidatus Saccharicenans sp.]|nr:SDR family NAD(P)-dependent oxidoreductase [Candidatus Saccharicenans sp.]